MFDYIKLIIKFDGRSVNSSVEQQSTSTRSAAQMELLSQVVKILKFILIAPAANQSARDPAQLYEQPKPG